MSPDYDMPDIVRKPPELPPRAERRSREARAGFWRASIVTAFFIAVLAANLYVGAVVVVGRVQSQQAIPGATGPTALITHPMLDGTFCRYSVFDNNTARTIEDKVELCGARGRVAAGTGKSDFSWGGK